MTHLTRLKDILLLLRAQLTLYYISAIVSAFVFAGNYEWLKMLLMWLSVCFVMFMGNIMNYYYDAEQDALHPMSASENPFTRGAFNVTHMKTMVFLFLAASILLAVPVGLYWVLAIFLGNFIGFTYDPKPFRMKSRPYGWFLSISLTLPLVFLFSYMIATSSLHLPPYVLLSVVFFYLCFVMILSKDIPDVNSDMSGKHRSGTLRTFPIVYGIKATVNVIIISNLLALLMYLIVMVMGSVSLLGLPFMVLVTAWIVKYMRQPREKLMERQSMYIKVSMGGIILLLLIFMFSVIVKVILGF
jgi:4-hydroxybenzoate polyprenyltransferase